MQVVRAQVELGQQDIDGGADGALGLLQLAHVPLGQPQISVRR